MLATDFHNFKTHGTLYPTSLDKLIDPTYPQIVKTSTGYPVRRYNIFLDWYEFLNITDKNNSRTLYWWTEKYMNDYCIGTEAKCKDALYDYLITQGKN